MPLKDWELSSAADAIAGKFIESHIECASHALTRVIQAQHGVYSEERLRRLFHAVLPDVGALKTFAYSHANGLTIPTGPGFGIAMSDAERLTIESELGTVLLLAGGAPEIERVGLANKPDFSRLTMDQDAASHLSALFDEASSCYAAGASLATVVMLGGLLEGVLLAKCQSNPAALESPAAPKDKSGTVRELKYWGLGDLIAVSSESGWIHATRHQLADILRDYRNFIHPHRVTRAGHGIDQGTASICWTVTSEILRDLGLLGDEAGASG